MLHRFSHIPIQDLIQTGRLFFFFYKYIDTWTSSINSKQQEQNPKKKKKQLNLNIGFELSPNASNLFYITLQGHV